MIDVEQEFGRCIESAGGRHVQDIVGNSPQFRNADYLFPADSVVAELKCLTEDKGSDEGIIKKASRLYEECLRAGDAPLLAFGTVKITTERFPEYFSRQIIELYRAPIHEQITKANRQIRETKAALRRDDHRGLLVLVNDGHTFLDPDHLLWIVDNTLSRHSFSAIDSVIIVTVNLRSRHPHMDHDWAVWIPISRTPERRCSEAFLDKLKDAWFSHLSRLTGHPTISFLADKDFIGKLTNVQPARGEAYKLGQTK